MNISDLFTAQQAGVTPAPALSLGQVLEERMRLAGMPIASSFVLRPNIYEQWGPDKWYGDSRSLTQPVGSVLGRGSITRDPMITYNKLFGPAGNTNNPNFVGR